jgi:dihydrofolate reductase
VNLFYLEESIKTYESLIAAFEQRREVLLARRNSTFGPLLAHIDESLRLNDGAIKAMESALKSAQENFWVVNGLTLAKQNRANHEISAHR